MIVASFLPDSSVLIPAVQTWHQHQRRARAELRRRLDDGEQMLLAGHALVECYAVLTRLPPPLRLPPQRVLELIHASYIEKGTVVALDPERYLELLATAAASGIAGGRTYDALIAASARAANADVLLTFNVRDFAGLVPGLDVHAPAAVE